MAEWSRHPLREREDLQRWITAVSDRFTVTTEQPTPLEYLNNAQHQSEAGHESNDMPSPDQSLLYDGTCGEDNLDTSDNRPPGADTAVETGRAEKLSNCNPDIYF